MDGWMDGKIGQLHLDEEDSWIVWIVLQVSIHKDGLNNHKSRRL